MLKGLQTRGAQDVLGRTSFRSSWMQPEGAVGSMTHEARVVDVNMSNWTVDCVSVFDQRRFFDIQVASPYMHSFAGEGVYAMPDIGAKCYVHIPSDGPPPFVLAFMMPMEAVTTASSEEAPGGTQSTGGPQKTPTDATFAGGRTKAKPGDIVMKGRDGNFMILHRGGVLQVGSTELAQRIYIPLGNLVTDISQNYNHFNTGGAINWGVRLGSPDDNPETEFKHTFRVFANDEFADMRVAVGKVHVPVNEPAADKGSTVDMANLNIAEDEPIVFELVLAPGGFDSDNGMPKDATDKTKLRLFFDRRGGVMFRSEAAVAVRVKEKMRLRIDDDFEVFGKKSFNFVCEKTATLQADSMIEIRTKKGVIKLNGGTKPVATVGSQVEVAILAPIPITTSNGPGTINTGAVLRGIVTTGNSTILA